jgi:gliding motility-associated-like protein
MRHLILPFLCCFLSITTVQATHIVGGEITYRCLGNNEYEVTLTVYRDCFNGVPWFDNPAALGIYNASWQLTRLVEMPLRRTSNDTIPVVLTNPCLTVPPNVCVHRTVYISRVTLPVRAGGYTLVYQRCCRNNLIRNIPDPLNTGISITVQLTETAMQACNSGAVFKNWPPVAICVREPIDFDHSAIDPDGDSLVYRLCTPLNGPDSLAPRPVPPGRGPYPPVVWNAPTYSLANVLGGDPLTIDARTGRLTGTPNRIGNFVVGVCVEEYRRGQLLSITRRDFQYNVADCGSPTATFFAPQLLCDTLRLQLRNQSRGAKTFRWYFDWGRDPAKTSTLPNPVWSFPDTGLYRIALIINPGERCTDTVLQTIRVARTTAQAALRFDFDACVEGRAVLKAQSQSTDPPLGISSVEWVLRGPQGALVRSGETNPSFLNLGSGTYQLLLIATGRNGCSDSLRMQVKSPVPPLDILRDSITLCAADSVALFPGADPSFSYSWSPPTGLSNPAAPNPRAFVDRDITYTVTAGTAGRCQLQKNVAILLKNPGLLQATAEPTVLYKGEQSQLNAIYPGRARFIWSPPTGLSATNIPDPVATPDDSITYTVRAILGDNCETQAQVTLRVLNPVCDQPFVFFPTGFSPNGDGENDVLQVEGRFLSEVYWVVYNRWGEKVFEANSAADAWDGRYKGEPQPPQAYGYYLRYVCPDGTVTTKKGNVTLLR